MRGILPGTLYIAISSSDKEGFDLSEVPTLLVPQDSLAPVFLGLGIAPGKQLKSRFSAKQGVPRHHFYGVSDLQAYRVSSLSVGM